MNNKKPMEESILDSYHRRARYISLLVAIIGVLFLLAWFLFVKKNYDLTTLVYCLSPAVMLFILNLIFDAAYRRRGD